MTVNRVQTVLESLLPESMSKERLIGATHYAMRLLRHRKNLPPGAKRFRVPGLVTEPTPEEETIAERLISAIEAAEHQELEALDERQAKGYLSALSQLVESRIQKSIRYTRREGKSFLVELRREENWKGGASVKQTERDTSELSGVPRRITIEGRREPAMSGARGGEAGSEVRDNPESERLTEASRHAPTEQRGSEASLTEKIPGSTKPPEGSS